MGHPLELEAGKRRPSFLAPLWVLAAVGILLAQSFVQAGEVPPLSSRVMDTVGLLQPTAKGALEAELQAYEQRTGRQFAVLLVAGLQDEPIEAYALRVVEAWHLGRKPQDDGLLLLISLHERRMRIEVGYGLEADITDALSSRIIHDVLRPAFRQRTYGPGIAQAMQVLMQAADKSPVEGLLPKAQDDESAENTPAARAAFLLLVVLLLLFGPRWLLPALMLLGQQPRGGGGRDDRFSGGGGNFGGGGASGGW